MNLRHRHVNMKRGRLYSIVVWVLKAEEILGI